jgi:DNA-binding GntR family transcriptional regulator
MTNHSAAARPRGRRKAGGGNEAAVDARLKRGAAAVDLRIHRAVVNAVMSRRLPPGTRLGEADFCQLYQVSRTTVRKALQRLAHDHIIELRPNRGAVVASPSPEEARDIFAARRALEREIVPLVIHNATPASLCAIRAALETEEAARRSGDRAAWIRLGGEFHLLLAELAGNAVLQRFMTELVLRCSLIIALYENPGAPMCGNHEHRDLLELIEQGRAAEASALIDHHLLEIEARLHLDQQERKVDLAQALAGC